jgi:hypothetical protein
LRVGHRVEPVELLLLLAPFLQQVDQVAVDGDVALAAGDVADLLVDPAQILLAILGAAAVVNAEGREGRVVERSRHLPATPCAKRTVTLMVTRDTRRAA